MPTYLLERKLQLAQEHEARMAAKAAAALPAGTPNRRLPGRLRAHHHHHALRMCCTQGASFLRECLTVGGGWLDAHPKRQKGVQQSARMHRPTPHA